MSIAIDMEVVRAAQDAVRAQWPDFTEPCGAAIFGSGWGEVVQAFKLHDVIPYEQIPGLGRPGVPGHAGELIRAQTSRGRWLVLFRGRRHFYEGHGWTPVAIPVFILQALRCPWVLLTNAAGGILPTFKPGDFMILRDHIHAMGSHPLVGTSGRWGIAMFPDMTDAYDAELRERLRTAACAMGVDVSEGVYIGVSGPTYETPAEVSAFRRWGADAVGMSTTPETILARALGLRVAAISCITNRAAGTGPGRLSHDEVVQVMKQSAKAAARWLRAFWDAME